MARAQTLGLASARRSLLGGRGRLGRGFRRSDRGLGSRLGGWAGPRGGLWACPRGRGWGRGWGRDWGWGGLGGRRGRGRCLRAGLGQNGHAERFERCERRGFAALLGA